MKFSFRSYGKAEALQHALAGLAAARGELAHEGQEIALAPSFAGAGEDVLRLRVLPATLSPGELHERLRAQLEDLVGGESPYLDALADRLTAAVLIGHGGLRWSAPEPVSRGVALGRRPR